MHNNSNNNDQSQKSNSEDLPQKPEKVPDLTPEEIAKLTSEEAGDYFTDLFVEALNANAGKENLPEG